MPLFEVTVTSLKNPSKDFDIENPPLNYSYYSVIANSEYKARELAKKEHYKKHMDSIYESYIN